LNFSQNVTKFFGGAVALPRYQAITLPRYPNTDPYPYKRSKFEW